MLVIVIIGCSDDDSGNEIPLTGKWVEVSTLSDTLTFLDEEFMLLDRGREIRSGNLLPKAGTGSYDYRLHSEKIALRWHLSSNSAYTEYQFNKVDDIITIENFYDPNAVRSIQTFRKIK
ncbi:MAG: hypothetical protein AAF992_10270 [Bacteroidota bacterium]